jgi:hypothetical protein
MQHEEIIREINDLHVSFDSRRTKILDVIKSLDETKNVHIDENEVEDLLNFVALALLKNKSKKEFRLGKTQTSDKSKLFEDPDDGQLTIRGFKCRTHNDVRFLSSWSSYRNQVYPFLPENFPKLVEDVKKKIERFNERNETEFEDAKMFSEIIVNEEVYWKNDDDKLDLHTPIKVTIIQCSFEKSGGYYNDHFKLKFFTPEGEAINFLDSSQHFGLLSDAFYKKIEEAIKSMREFNQGLEDKKKRTLKAVHKLIDDAGYRKYLMLREI